MATAPSPSSLCRSAGGSPATCKSIEEDGNLSSQTRASNGEYEAGGPPALRHLSAQLFSALLLVCPLFTTGCFSAWANSWGHPSPGQQVGFFLLDVATLPAQVVFAAGAGLDAIREKREKNAQEREIRKEAEFLRANPQIIRDDPEFLDQWNHIRASALARLVADPTMSFTETQLIDIEAIWTRQNRLLCQGRGGWRAPCTGLWLRPEWSRESLERGIASLQREGIGSGMRENEWREYASSPNVPERCLHLILARAPECGVARSNIMSRIVRDDAWRSSLRERYRIAEWDPPATNIATQADADGVLRELGQRYDSFFVADVTIDVLPSQSEARERLLEKCGEWNNRCALVLRFPGDTAIGERCYSDTTGDTPHFVAFVRANAVVVATKKMGSTSQALEAADWVDRKLCQRIGVARDGKTDIYVMDHLRTMALHGRDRMSDIRQRNNERALRQAADSAAFLARMKELCPEFKGKIALWGVRYVYGWGDDGRLTIEQVGREFAGGASPDYLLFVARELLEGRRTGLEGATDVERDQFRGETAAFASSAGVSAYAWDSFVRR